MTDATTTDTTDTVEQVAAPTPDAAPPSYPPSAPIHEGGRGHAEPSDAQYIWIAVMLAVLTALEVAASEIGSGPWVVPALLVMMVVKFFVVVSFFMHLRFDNKLFSFLFYLGLGFAIVLYAGVLATFHFFTG